MRESNVIPFAPAAARLRRRQTNRAIVEARHNSYAGGIDALWIGDPGRDPAIVIPLR
jgi:hypothetical protein